MCGIFGAVGRGSWVSGLRLEEAVESMRHRGPDAEGTWTNPSARGEGEGPACALGHTRLSIIDLSEAGRQPMVTSDGRYVLVYNGEVYNFQEIRKELEALGATFRSATDTEVILKAFERWGEACVQRLRGMFAFAVWDERDGSLFLARDRFGIKPLYMVKSGHGIAFASEVRTLLRAGAVEPVLSPTGLLGYLRYGSVQDPETLVAGVRALPAGATLTLRHGATQTTRYWSLPQAAPDRKSSDDAVRDLRPVLNEATRLHLISDVPFGVFLSGGVDSSALTALAARASTTPIHTFTVTFDEKAYSEELFAAKIAARFGCAHTSVHISGGEAAAAFDEALASQDQPSADGFNTWLVARSARRAGLSMALSGLGGDEVFAGYQNFHRFGRLLAFARTASRVPPRLRAWLERRLAVPGAPNRFRKALALAATDGRPDLVYGVLRRAFTDAQLTTMIARPALRRAQMAKEEEDPETVAALDAADPVNAFARLELDRYLRNTLLRDTDSMSMASSLEVRVPFLDHRLVEEVSALYGIIKISPDENKPLLTGAVPEMPAEVARRPKMGFVLPLSDWFRGPLRDRVERSLVGSDGPAAGLLLRPAVASAWRSFQSGDDSVSASRFFGLASLATWCDRHRMVLPW
jgi:asparagine synthase (glutamine-hydrolysing)